CCGALKRAMRWRWKGCEPPAFLHGGYNADTMRGYTAAERSGLCVNRILIVEDEATISRLIEVSLTRAGYACTVANDGLAAADQIEQQDFDLALLDIMLPGLDGYELLDYLRPLGTPVIFITAKGTTKDRVKGLSRGADDYLVKPFEVEELLARVGAVLRRTGRGGQLLTAFGVTLDVSGRSVTQDGNPVELTPREFALLA